MNHHASAEFWRRYRALPLEIQDSADAAFKRLQADPRHPGLHFRRVGPYWSARVGLHYRALAIEVDEGYCWFWIGTHAEYDELIG